MARDSSIDIAKGIGITLVVFFHFVHLNKRPYFYEWGGVNSLYQQCTDKSIAVWGVEDYPYQKGCKQRCDIYQNLLI